MNPTIQALVERLEAYGNIDYGANAYALSTAEAKLLVETLNPVYDSDDSVPKDFIVKPRTSSDGTPYFNRSHYMAQRYLSGEDMWDIAKVFNVTRERVRQCVAKIRRESMK